MHQALYRKYRPRTFDDVCGQEHITDVLKYQVKTGTVSHAYLFCGSRGTGKTTCAKILAKAVNCPDCADGNPCCKCDICRNIDSGISVDVLEMDAASNTGVDYIRDIKENVAYSASEVKNKVFIIDEVHMLSASAFNALLKTLEEPPQNVIFVLATTEMRKIPATVLSRCQRFEFRRIPDSVIVDRLSYIAEREGISLSLDAARLIAVLSRGGMRDAISMFELCSASGEEITLERVRDVVGVAGRGDVVEIFSSLINKDFPAVFGLIGRLRRASKDFGTFIGEMLSFYRDMLLIRACNKKIDKSLFELTDDEFQTTLDCSEKISSEMMLYHSEVLENTLNLISRNTADAALLTELCFIQMATPSLNSTPKALLARISALETGAPVMADAKDRSNVSEKREPEKNINTSAGQRGGSQINVPADDMSFSEKPATYWSDVKQKFSVTNAAVGGFMQNARAYKGTDGKLRVYVKDSFSANMLTMGDNVSSLLNTVRIYDSDVTGLEVIVRADIKDEDEMSAFDDFIKNSGEE